MVAHILCISKFESLGDLRVGDVLAFPEVDDLSWLESLWFGHLIAIC
jgi:hypothetical protein